jgi:hypothetical protein
MTSPPGKIAVVQVSSGARCNASLPSTKRRNRKRLVNRDENRAFCFSRMRRPKRHLLIGEVNQNFATGAASPWPHKP